MRDDGADASIDYSTEDVARRTLELAGGPVDAIADLVGGDLLNRALGALKTMGSAASIATPELDLDAVLDNNITFHGVLIGDDGTRTRRLADLFARGVVRPHLSHVLPLEDAAQAHRILESGHAGGKVVLTVRPPDRGRSARTSREETLPSRGTAPPEGEGFVVIRWRTERASGAAANPVRETSCHCDGVAG